LRDRVIISICGPSGCGKSMLAKEVVKAIGKDMSVRIPTDYFLKSSVYKNYEEFISSPFHYDWKLLEQLTDKPLGKEIEIPDYDFTKFKRNINNEGTRLMLRRYIVLDSILPYPKADFVIMLDDSKEERQKRLKERDKQWNTNVISNWKKLEVTGELLQKSKKFVNLELDGSLDKKENCEKILELLRNRNVLG
jgi:uridine kinase